MTSNAISQEIRLKLAVKAAKMGIWEWNIITGEVFWSEETRKLFGVDINEYVPTYESYAKFVHPDDLAMIEQKVKAAFDGSGEYSFQHRIIRSNGEIAWIECHGELLRTVEGRPEKLIGTTIDITNSFNDKLALQAKERELRKAQQIAGLVSFTWNMNNNVFTWSEEMHNLFGIPQSEFDGLSETIIKRCVHPDDQQKVFVAQTKVFAEKRNVPIEFRIVRPNGEVRTVWGDGEVILDKNGNMTEMIGTIQDITERKKIENELRRLKGNLEDLVTERTAELQKTKQELLIAKNQAEVASNEKSSFLSRMSHELRTPLNAIMGFSQLLTLKSFRHDEQNIEKNAREILQASELLLNLINEILDLSRIEAGEIEIKLKPLNITDTCRKCFSMVQPLAQQKNISIKLDMPENSEVSVLADETRLQQIMSNLLSNAIKYNRDGGEIQIQIEVLDSKLCEISVRDNGIGIPEASLKDLFVPFKRMGADARGIEGTGIGLVICKKLIELMGGKIFVESRENVGTTFWFTLPLSKQKMMQIDEFKKEIDVSKQDGSQPVVLYVEDNLINLRLMKAIFEDMKNIKLETAMSVEEGFQKCLQKHYELLLVDIALPDGTGYDLINRLRQIGYMNNVHSVAISANALKQDIEKSFEQGFDKYITKPIDISEFCHLIQDTLV